MLVKENPLRSSPIFPVRASELWNAVPTAPLLSGKGCTGPKIIMPSPPRFLLISSITKNFESGVADAAVQSASSAN